jgi:hypothetical protein
MNALHAEQDARPRRPCRALSILAGESVSFGPKAHDGTIITDTRDEMWGTVRRFIVR